MARSGAALILFILGMMFTFIGLILGSLCLFSGGLLCDGTLIGEMSSYFLMPGLAFIALGILASALVRRHRKRHPPPVAPPVARQHIEIRLEPEDPAPGLPAARVASKCPNCGGPVHRAAPTCQWCDTPLL